MQVTYEFAVGDRVYVDDEGAYGEVISVVPGDGRDPWYYVVVEGRGEDRYQAHQLTGV